MKHYLIDSENVGDFWIPLLELPAESTELIVFYTKNSPHMSYDSLIKLKESDRTVTFIKCYEGTNALDFQLCSELGFRIAMNKGDDFIIVTNDTGYDAAVKYWRHKEYSVKRIAGKDSRVGGRRRGNLARIDVAAEVSSILNVQVQEPEDNRVAETAVEAAKERLEAIEADTLAEQSAAAGAADASLREREAEIAEDAADTAQEDFARALENAEDTEAAEFTDALTETAAIQETAHSPEEAEEASEVNEELSDTEETGEDSAEEMDLPSAEEEEASEEKAAESAEENTEAAESAHGSVEKEPETVIQAVHVEAAAEKEDQEENSLPEETTEETSSDEESLENEFEKPPFVPDMEEITAIVNCIGMDNLAELHNQLIQFYGEHGKEVYQLIKNGSLRIDKQDWSREEKFLYYSALIFRHSDEPEEAREEENIREFADFLLGAEKKRQNLNSLRYALLKHYGKEKGRRYYFLLKPYVKALNQM